jgi:hypothetical protein
VLLHSIRLEISFSRKGPFPALKGWGVSVENELIPLFPDCPGCYYEEFHKEVMTCLSFGFFHHSMERQIKTPANFQMRPTSLTKLARKEQVKGRFLIISWTQNIIVVVVLEFMFFSSENIP